MDARTIVTGAALGFSVAVACADPHPSTLNQKCFADENCDAGQQCEKQAGADAGFCREEDTAFDSTSSGAAGGDTMIGTSGGVGPTPGSTGATSEPTAAETTTEVPGTDTTSDDDTGGGSDSVGSDSTGGEQSCDGVPSPDRVSFGEPNTLPVDANSQGLALGDLDGDGTLDFAVTSLGTDTVRTFLGDGLGNFAPAETSLAGPTPSEIALGAIADATVDAVIVQSDNTVRRAQGTGDGGFINAQAVGSTDTAIALVDINGDDVLDLLGNDGELTVALGTPVGETFGTTIGYPSGVVGSGELTVADFDGNGAADVAIAGSIRFAVMLGNGAGTFVAEPPFILPGQVADIASGDFDADDQADVVVVTQGGGTDAARVYWGGGDGTLSADEVLGTQTGPQYVRVADLDADGDDDIAVMHTGGALGISLSNGDGTFAPQQSFPCGDNNNMRGLVLGDLNGDCALDAASVSATGDVVCVWLSN